MAKIHTKNPKIKPKISCFPSCFVFFHQKEEKSPEIIGSNSRKKSRWISWNRFRMKNSGIKTVPVENSISVGKSNVDEEIKVVEPEKVGGKRQIPANIDRKSSRIPAVVTVVSNQSASEKPRMAKYAGSAQSTILESGEQSNPHVLGQDDTCQKQPYVNRKSDQTKTISHRHQISSPANKPNQAVTVSHSSSFPPPGGRSKSATEVGNLHVLRKKPSRKNDIPAGKFDAVIGMSILMVTLAIMLLWGMTCAIICTSALFYFSPYFTAVIKSSDNVVEKKSNTDYNLRLDSDEYKKKVILEGLLERNHRSSPRVW